LSEGAVLGAEQDFAGADDDVAEAVVVEVARELKLADARAIFGEEIALRDAPRRRRTTERDGDPSPGEAQEVLLAVAVDVGRALDREVAYGGEADGTIEASVAVAERDAQRIEVRVVDIGERDIRKTIPIDIDDSNGRWCSATRT
jgi:hypothetical protein